MVGQLMSTPVPLVVTSAQLSLLSLQSLPWVTVLPASGIHQSLPEVPVKQEGWLKRSQIGGRRECVGELLLSPSPPPPAALPRAASPLPSPPPTPKGLGKVVANHTQLLALDLREEEGSGQRESGQANGT